MAAALAVPGFVCASPLPTVRTAWLAEHEAFAAWYAHERKWDAENGISLELVLFPTGKNLVDNMRGAGCVIGGCGGAAAVFGLLDKRIYVIGVGSDETAANAVYVRPDSPLLALKGENPSYPELYGSAAAMQGKTVLAPVGTSAHQLLYFCWNASARAMRKPSSLIRSPRRRSRPLWAAWATQSRCGPRTPTRPKA